MHNLIPILITAIAVATILNVGLKHINMPTIIGYIFTGAIIGAVFHLNLHGDKTLEHIAEFGVVFLMFTIGLEFSFAHLNSMKREVFLIGLLQVILTAAIITLVTQLFFDINLKAGIIVGAGLALSSTAIVLKILNETGKIKSDVGRNALGILIFQDIAVIPILLMITIFTDQGRDLSDMLMSTAINAVIALGILVIIGKYVLGHVFKVVSNTGSKEIYMGSILMTVIGASYIAHYFGFSYSLGGFIAGMMIADTMYKYQVEADLIPFRDLLLGVFFVSVGLQINFNIVLANILAIVLLVIGIMLIKSITIFAILVFTSGRKVALKSAITLSQVGEFSLVVFSLVLANQMMNPAHVQVLMVVVIISMVLTPFMINNVDAITGLFIKGDIQEDALDQSSLIGGHVILCGYGAFGRTVSEELDRSVIEHVIVTNNTEAFVKAKESGKTVVFGDPADRDLLERLQIKKAMSVVIALDDFDEVKQTSAAITLLDPDIKVIAKVPSEEERLELAEFNHEYLIDGNSHTATMLVDQVNKSRLLARETSKLQFLGDYSIDQPAAAIYKVEREQARLLEVISRSFNALREEKDIMHIKAYHDSFKVLSEIVGAAINDIIANANLGTQEYERINTLLDNQHKLILMNESVEELAKELKAMENIEQLKTLAQMAVEGLDAILLSLMDIANKYSEEDAILLKNMTSERGGDFSRVRGNYLDADTALDSPVKALLLSSTNHMDRLRSLFGSVGENYRKLGEAL
jgi:CPA2 family monovalent cation:H+ antiporter-2